MIQDPVIKAQVAKALRQMGAKTYQVLRIPKDLNGQPTGEAQEVGKIYGLCFQDASTQNRIHIDLPGVITRGSDPSLVAVMLCGSPPQKGDLITKCGNQTSAVNVIISPPVLTITLEELI